jgi:heavy metal translocating P-type ATPase
LAEGEPEPVRLAAAPHPSFLHLASIAKTLEGLRATVLSGAFLAVSFLFWLLDAAPAVDPAWATIVISGIPLVYLAVRRLVAERAISSALLIVMAMVASIHVGEIFAAGEVVFIMAIGALLEEMTVEKSASGLRQLVSLAPPVARILSRDGDRPVTRTVSVESLVPGDTLRVLPGETVAVDGIIASGSSSIDEAPVTGESLPVDKGPGDPVFSGTLNLHGSFDFVATRKGEDSTVQKLIALTRKAAESKAPLARLVDRWAAWLVPVALLIAIAVYLFTGDLKRGVTILVVFCPCALVLATPVSIVAAIGRATKKGIIVKSGAALEALGRAQVLCLDKTGTLTLGKPALTEIVAIPGSAEPEPPVSATGERRGDPPPADGEDSLLCFGATAESLSEHPLGRALVKAADERGVAYGKPADFSYIPGKGVAAATEGGERILCGNLGFMRGEGVPVSSEAEEALGRVLDKGRTPMLCAVNGRLRGIFGFLDTLKGGTERTLEELSKYSSLKLLTGDDEKAAMALFGGNAALSAIIPSMSPVDKAEYLTGLKEGGLITAMAGDGVNDAPALKTADVGIAMGALGSDIAIGAADVVLMGDDIESLPFLKKLSVKTLSTIRLNITLSMLINAAAITLSALGILTPVTGALVHNAGSTLVVLNAARLYNRKI